MVVKTKTLFSLKSCRGFLPTLTDVECEKDKILEWFQELCGLLTKTITEIVDCKQEIRNLSQTDLLLYLTQLVTWLSFLINALVKEDEIGLPLLEVRKSAVKQMMSCLEGIESTLTHPTVLTDPSGSFIKCMDACFEKISETDFDSMEIRHLFEQALSHAMSIAQIALVEDSKAIRGGCESVLISLNSLTTEINRKNSNSGMISLFLDGCSHKLCRLERRVNTAVLKLCLNTFSGFTLPLRRLHDFCLDSENKLKIGEFDSLVVEFDLHVDRIMQIGLFAVSCSNNLKRGIKIRSCLASLEALEGELVPALNTVLSDQTVENKNYAALLVNHWLHQANSLKQLIYLIVDPFAFTQIVYEEASDTVNNLSLVVTKQRLLLTQLDLSLLIDGAEVLRSFLEIARQEFTEMERTKVQSEMKKFEDILDEVRCASKALLEDGKVDRNNCFRVLKRCKILVVVLKRLSYCFNEEIKEFNESVAETASAGEIQAGNAFLDHIIQRGQQILKDRSILYKTPTKMSNIILNTSNKASKFTHLRKFSFLNLSTKTDISLDLQITEILGEMTQLRNKT